MTPRNKSTGYDLDPMQTIWGVWRRESGMKLKFVAEKIGVSRYTLSNYERLRVTVPKSVEFLLCCLYVKDYCHFMRTRDPEYNCPFGGNHQKCKESQEEIRKSLLRKKL